MEMAQKKKITPLGEQGNLFNTDFPMYQSLLQTAPQLSNGVFEAERNAIQTQSEKKREKTNTS